MTRAVPLVLLLAVAGCEATAAILAPSPAIELPQLEHEAVKAHLAAKGIDLAQATEVQVLDAAKEELAPLPIDSAKVTESGAVQVVIGPLSTPVIAELLNKIGVGGIAGIAGGGVASIAGLLYLLTKWRELMRRAKKVTP